MLAWWRDPNNAEAIAAMKVRNLQNLAVGRQRKLERLGLQPNERTRVIIGQHRVSTCDIPLNTGGVLPKGSTFRIVAVATDPAGWKNDRLVEWSEGCGAASWWTFKTRSREITPPEEHKSRDVAEEQEGTVVGDAVADRATSR